MGIHLIAFVAASIVLIVIPGVDFALVTRQVVCYGRRSALATAVGLLVGGLSHATFAVVGLSALLLASAEAYVALKLAGAAYLIWLGVNALRSGARHRVAPTGTDARAGSRSMSVRRAFTLGLLSDLLNVKVAVFFVTFLPQFVTPGPGITWRIALLGLLFNVLASSWWVTYILLMDRLHAWFTRSAVRRAIDRITGVVLIGVGVGVAVER
jgi:threonine/homoserine/homoserine lactone efflux protein